MLFLIGTVLRVGNPVEETDKESGKITMVSKLQIQHQESADENSDIKVENIKIKSEPGQPYVQADNFRKVAGQRVQIPVRTWAFSGRSGYWLEKGVVPTLVKQPQ